MEVFLRRLPIGQLRLLLEARQRHALGVELERGRGKRVQQQQVVMRGGVALIVLDREKLLRAITGGGVEVDPPQLLQGIDRETVRVSVREHVNLLESLRDVGVRGDQRQPHLLGEPPRVLDLPRILAAPVDERPDIVQHQMRQRKAGTGRAGVVLDDVEGIDAAGDARAHPARVRHRRVVHRRLDARLVQHLAVARQGGDQVGADLVEQARGHGGLADDVQPLALGEVQQPDEEGVRALRAEVLPILLLHLEPQRAHVVFADSDFRGQPRPPVAALDPRRADPHRPHRPGFSLFLFGWPSSRAVRMGKRAEEGGIGRTCGDLGAKGEMRMGRREMGRLSKI